VAGGPGGRRCSDTAGLSHFPEHETDAGEVHGDAEPEERRFVCGEKDGGAGEPENGEYVGEVVGAAGEHRGRAGARAGGDATDRGGVPRVLGVEVTQVHEQTHLRPKPGHDRGDEPAVGGELLDGVAPALRDCDQA